LLNVSYKIASSCIAERLKNVLPTIVHECQNGFLKGRFIGDNIRQMYDVMTYTENENIPGLLFMIDFEKAFDSVSWSFLHKALDFFNFGPMMKKWILLFYSGINSCVSLNGQYSPWFPILRGVRQGDPSSPYIYLICAEILSLLIRQNDRIKGIRLNDKECLLSQFADDTTLYLDGSEASFNEAIATLLKFSKISGLKMNTEKTQVVWIGSRKNCNIKYMRDENFVWNPGTFKVLGVKFSTDLTEIGDINFGDKLLAIKRVIKMWKKRKLTPLGKIAIIKSLLMSKLTHLLISLPDPSEQFLKQLEKEFYDFLWDGKVKIKKTIVCKQYKQGGLQMIDIRAFVTSLKLSWLKKLRIDSSWKMFTINLYPDIATVHNYGSEYANVIMSHIKNAFWKDVMRHYKKLYAKCKIITLDEFMAECIHYNINILRDRQVIFVKEWCDAGIVHIRHLVNALGAFMSFQEFQTNYPNVRRTGYLMYEGILRAIRRYSQKLKIHLSNNFKIFDTKIWFIMTKGNKWIQFCLAESEEIPTAVKRWNEKINYNFTWEKIFQLCFKTTQDVQLRWFQLRILHRILATEEYLHTCKIVNSPLCNFCNAENQDIVHLNFWQALLNLLKDKCTHTGNLAWNDMLIVFGMSNRIITDIGLDKIILWAKFYIFKSKMQKTVPSIQAFLPILKYKVSIEKYLSKMNGSERRYTQTWTPYMTMVN
jgi:hypothetical protein